jgi:hypothetical protein
MVKTLSPITIFPLTFLVVVWGASFVVSGRKNEKIAQHPMAKNNLPKKRYDFSNFLLCCCYYHGF